MSTCFLCDKGFPITVDGWHYGSQSKGMIETTLCEDVPFDSKKAIAKDDSPWLRAACAHIADLKQQLDGLAIKYQHLSGAIACHEITPEVVAELRRVAEATSIPWNGEVPMLARLKAAEAERDNLKEILTCVDVVMDTAALCGIRTILAPAYAETWASTHAGIREALGTASKHCSGSQGSRRPPL